MDIRDIRIADIQPSQFYISEAKLEQIRRWFHPEDLSGFEAVPVKELDGRVVFTDGHTRAYAAWLAGLDRIPLVWEEDDLDWEAYRLCVDACKKRGVCSVADLEERVVSEEDYERLWNGWCEVLHEILELQRAHDGEQAAQIEGSGKEQAGKL